MGLCACFANASLMSAHAMWIPYGETQLRPETAQELSLRCREDHPDATTNPSNPGGLSIVNANGARALCMYGSLERVPIAKLSELLRTIVVDTVVLRSTGGPVKVWLSLAEALVNNVSNIVVDDACFSSCANYAFVLGRWRQSNESALVVWHGGPTGQTEDLADTIRKSGAAFSMSTKLEKDYKDLAARTISLYERLKINPEILDITQPTNPPARAVELAQNILGSTENVPPFSGYALPPETLSKCFGLTGMDQLWYPSNPNAITRIGFERSRSLFLAAIPEELQKLPCMAPKL